VYSLWVKGKKYLTLQANLPQGKTPSSLGVNKWLNSEPHESVIKK